VDDRQDGPDREPQRRAGTLRRRGIRRVSGQPQADGQPMKRMLFSLALVLLAAARPTYLGASDPATGDWPMWGGTPDRNMVSNMKGLAADWVMKTKKKVEWGTEHVTQRSVTTSVA